MAVEIRKGPSPFDKNMVPVPTSESEELLPPFKQKGVIELLAEFKNRTADLVGKKMNFQVEQGFTAHNPSIPFIFEGQEYIAVRTDILDKDLSSKVVICRRQEDTWKQIDGMVFDSAEDPSISIIGGAPVLTFVRVSNQDLLDKNPVEFGLNDGVRFNQEFYMMVKNDSSEFFVPLPFKGPVDMKDIRLSPTNLGERISGFGRPKEHFLGKELLYKGSGDGSISYFEASTLGGVTSELIKDAPILKGMFKEGEWGGVNQVNILKNGLLGLIGHIAYEDKEGKHYYAIAFAFDPETLQFSNLKIIATRDSFPEGISKPVKSADGKIRTNYLKDIIFPGGIIRRSDGWADLFVGLSDAEAGMSKIPDPLLEYERLNQGEEMIEKELLIATQ